MIKTRVIENALGQKGFQKKPGDHNFYYFYINGIRTNIKTKTSHGSGGHSGKEVGPYLEKKMRDQLHLTKDQFNSFIECPLKEADLVQIYVDELKLIDEKLLKELGLQN